MFHISNAKTRLEMLPASEYSKVFIQFRGILKGFAAQRFMVRSCFSYQTGEQRLVSCLWLLFRHFRDYHPCLETIFSFGNFKTWHSKIHCLSPTHSWSWVLLEEPPIVQPLKNFPEFYGTRRFITVFTRTLHWSLSWASSVQSIPFHPISLRSFLILFTHLRLGLLSIVVHKHMLIVDILVCWDMVPLNFSHMNSARGLKDEKKYI
jgi:hypothetical protein